MPELRTKRYDIAAPANWLTHSQLIRTKLAQAFKVTSRKQRDFRIKSFLQSPLLLGPKPKAVLAKMVRALLKKKVGPFTWLINPEQGMYTCPCTPCLRCDMCYSHPAMIGRVSRPWAGGTRDQGASREGVDHGAPSPWLRPPSPQLRCKVAADASAYADARHTAALISLQATTDLSCPKVVPVAQVKKVQDILSKKPGAWKGLVPGAVGRRRLLQVSPLLADRRKTAAYILPGCSLMPPLAMRCGRGNHPWVFSRLQVANGAWGDIYGAGAAQSNNSGAVGKIGSCPCVPLLL